MGKSREIILDLVVACLTVNLINLLFGPTSVSGAKSTLTTSCYRRIRKGVLGRPHLWLVTGVLAEPRR